MKAKDFAQFVGTFSDVLAAAGANEAAKAWQTLLPIFSIKPTANVSTICKAIDGMSCSSHHTGIHLQRVIGLIPALERCLATAAKKAMVDDLKLLGKTMAPFAHVSVSTFADVAVARMQLPATKGRNRKAEPGVDIVQKYLRRLEQTLGDEPGFAEVFATMKKDAAVKAADAKKLSKEFAGKAATSKTQAFDLIWKRHASLMGARADAEATAGRTAA